MTKLLVFFASITVMIFYSVSCSTVRRVTYPPGFIYLEKREVKSTMHRFAANLNYINAILSKEKIVSEKSRTDIIEHLQDIERAAIKLGAGQAGATNRCLINHNISQFKDAVSQSVKMIQRTPPNYYYAGNLTGRCSACHTKR